MTNDAIRVTVTITDHDLDQAPSQPVNIGKYIGFADDGPTVSANALVVSDDENATSPDRPPECGRHRRRRACVHDRNVGAQLWRRRRRHDAADRRGLPTMAGAEGTFYQTVSADGMTLTISQVQGGVGVAVLQVDAVNATAGAYTVTQLHAIDHATRAGREQSAVHHQLPG